MNPHIDPDSLERQIDRALKALPELPAPATLAPRVLARLAQRQAAPWYRQGWQSWPSPCQGAALTLLVALFGGLCLAGWKATQFQGMAQASERVDSWTSWLAAFWNTVHALWSALVCVIQQLGTGWVIGGVAAAVVGYALCIGLGTLCVRLALAQPASLNRPGDAA